MKKYSYAQHKIVLITTFFFSYLYKNTFWVFFPLFIVDVPDYPFLQMIGNIISLKN